MEIFLWDGTSTTQLTNNDYDDTSPQIGNNGSVVWAYCDGAPCSNGDGSGVDEIMLYDGTSITQLTDNDYQDNYPRINDNGWVVWTGCDGLDCSNLIGDDEIFLYDGTTTIQLTDNDYHDGYAQINNNGWVAWMRGIFSDLLFVWNGTSTTQFTTSQYGEYGQFYYYDINDNGWLVWNYHLDQVEHPTEIVLWDGTSETQLTNNAYLDKAPKLNDNGSVVWVRRVNTTEPGFEIHEEIMLYDGTTTIQLTDNDYQDGYPQINDNGSVVWMGCAQGNSWDLPELCEIYLYDGTSVTQITNNEYNDFLPQINNDGRLVWYGSDGSDYEIFLAIPDDTCIDNDSDGYGNPANAECTHTELDCNNSNGNIYPTNPNTYCDCEGTYPQGTTEICGNGIDEDCNGADLACGSCAGSTVEASTYNTSAVLEASDLAKHLPFLLLPVGAIIGLMIWRRKK